MARSRRNWLISASWAARSTTAGGAGSSLVGGDFLLVLLVDLVQLLLLLSPVLQGLQWACSTPSLALVPCASPTFLLYTMLL
jgi:hypothetical protein